MILGIDEVGRGPWAGPLVIGAVVLGGTVIEGLTDSKKLTKKRRDELDIIIRRDSAGYGLGWVDAHEIDEIGLSAALVLATKRAVKQVNVPYHEIIIDGTINFLKDTTKGKFVTTLKKADLLIPSVSAASIIAKVARDNYMIEQADVYPEYKFSAHVGYGTVAHRAAIDLHGVTPLHRLSFAPLAKYRTATSAPVVSGPVGVDVVTTKEIGDTGEDAAMKYLIEQGHEVIDRNWRTKFCEIDIISQHDNTIYFTEVKYRKNDNQGGGLAAITSQKQRQMKFAAEYYAVKNKLNDTNLRLVAIDVAGRPPVVRTFIKLG
jgi:ribonuclease HII